MAASIDSGVMTDARVALMPRVISDLLEAERWVLNTVEVAGEAFFEVMCGCACLTLGCLFANVPCVRPWDLCYGKQYGVRHGKWPLIRLARSRRVAQGHFGTPCRSVTWARDPPLRDEPRILADQTCRQRSKKSWIKGTS